MGAIPTWLQKWIARLLPKQINRGNGVVQIGKMGGGNVTIVHLTQHLSPVPASVPVPPIASMPPAPLAEPAARPFRPSGVANAEQREVLSLIRKLHNNVPVLEFMQREFGTYMVIHLQPPQLFRVRRYVEEIIQSEDHGGPR